MPFSFIFVFDNEILLLYYKKQSDKPFFLHVFVQPNFWCAFMELNLLAHRRVT